MIKSLAVLFIILNNLYCFPLNSRLHGLVPLEGQNLGLSEMFFSTSKDPSHPALTMKHHLPVEMDTHTDETKHGRYTPSHPRSSFKEQGDFVKDHLVMKDLSLQQRDRRQVYIKKMMVSRFPQNRVGHEVPVFHRVA